MRHLPVPFGASCIGAFDVMSREDITNQASSTIADPLHDVVVAGCRVVDGIRLRLSREFIPSRSRSRSPRGSEVVSASAASIRRSSRIISSHIRHVRDTMRRCERVVHVLSLARDYLRRGGQLEDAWEPIAAYVRQCDEEDSRRYGRGDPPLPAAEVD